MVIARKDLAASAYDESQKEKEQQFEANKQLTTGGAGGGSSVAPVGQPQQGPSTGRFTNLQKYLDVNRGQGQQLAQRIVGEAKKGYGGVETTADKIKGDIGQSFGQVESTADKLESQIQGGQPVEGADDKTVGAFTETGAYNPDFDPSVIDRDALSTLTGDVDYFDEDAYKQQVGGAITDYTQALGGAKAAAQGLGTETGRSRYLQSLAGTNRALPIAEFLMQAEGSDALSGGLAGIRGDIGSFQSNLGDLDVLAQADTSGDYAEGSLADYMAKEQAIKDKITGDLGDIYGGAKEFYTGEYGSRQEERDAEIAKSRALESLLSNPSVENLNKAKEIMGGKMQDLFAYANKTYGLNLNAPGYNVFPNTQLTGAFVPESGELATYTPEEAARLNALAELAGQTSDFTGKNLSELDYTSGRDFIEQSMSQGREKTLSAIEEYMRRPEEAFGRGTKRIYYDTDKMMQKLRQGESPESVLSDPEVVKMGFTGGSGSMLLEDFLNENKIVGSQADDWQQLAEDAKGHNLDAFYDLGYGSLLSNIYK